MSQQPSQQQIVHAVTATSAGVASDASKFYAYRALMQKPGFQKAQAESILQGSVVGDILEFIGGAGIAVWQFLEGKSSAKKAARRTAYQTQVQEGIDAILQKMEIAGLELIDAGYVPGSTEFEQTLNIKLKDVMGYWGNCNATVYAPGATGPNKTVMFRASDGGRKLDLSQGVIAPPNLQTIWYVSCKNIRDGWVTTYQDKLIAEGRLRELEQFQSELSKARGYLRLGFGIVTSMLMIIFIYQATRIK